MRIISIYRFLGIFLLFTNIDDCLGAKPESWDAIFRSETHLEINLSTSSAVYTERGEYIILNKEGLKFSTLHFAYGFNSKIADVSATIKRIDGKVIMKYKKSDFEDTNAQSSGSLYIDTRLKSINLQHFKFPYIIEYEVKKNISNFFVYPAWQPKMDYRLLNLSSSYSLSVTDPAAVSIYEQNITQKDTLQQKHLTTYKWEVDSLQPISDESFSYSEYWNAPKVLSAPRSFNLEFTGSNNSWSEFGNWIYHLNENRGELTEKEKNTIDSLLSSSTNQFQKIDILYNYLKSNTRYVSIQDGIGGWQPFTASFVCEKKFGDCKALTNYMQALLKHAGIKSYYSLVKAGNSTSDIITSFPSNQFNHAILMIPNQSDTIWLDCTSNLTPTGFVEKFIADRYALVIVHNNSYLAKIPTYDTLQNAEHINGFIQLNADLTGKGKISFKNYAHRSISSRIMDKYYNSSTREKYLKEDINFPSFMIISEEHHEEVENYIPLTTDSIDIKINIAGKKAGSDFFLSYPVKMNVYDIEPYNRKTDIYIPDSYSRTDSLLCMLPNGYELTTSTKIEFNSDFGNYKYSIQPDGNTILFLVRYSLIKGRYPMDRINDFKKLINHINKTESYEIIVSQKQQN